MNVYNIIAHNDNFTNWKTEFGTKLLVHPINTEGATYPAEQRLPRSDIVENLEWSRHAVKSLVHELIQPNDVGLLNGSSIRSLILRACELSRALALVEEVTQLSYVRLADSVRHRGVNRLRDRAQTVVLA